MGDLSTEDIYRDQLLSALKGVARPGNYAAGGTVRTCMPGLQVPALGGGGHVALPLTPSEARDIAGVCTAAPFGRR